MKEYWQEVSEEYQIPLPDNPTDKQLSDWAVKIDLKQKELLDKYGESSWNIHRFMELVRSEKISESKFRELVRYEMDKNFKQKENPSK